MQEKVDSCQWTVDNVNQALSSPKIHVIPTKGRAWRDLGTNFTANVP